LVKKYVSPFIFFFLEKGRVVVWDYKNHQQFELEQSYFERLSALSQGDETDSPIDKELFEANMIFYSDVDIEWGWDMLSKIFHIGTQDIPLAYNTSEPKQFIQNYMEFCEKVSTDIPCMFTEKIGVKHTLPPPNCSLFSTTDLWSVLQRRKTSRSFTGESVSLNIISTLLYAVFGNIHPEWADLTEYNLSDLSYRKSSPSAGGLHPSEAYLVALNVQDIEPGVYHYESHTHSLTSIRENKDIPKLGPLLAGQSFAERLSAGIFITARFEKSWHKYKHSKAYNHILLDIGHLSQTFQLCVTAIGLYPWLTAAFSEKQVIKLLKLEGTSEYPMFFVGVGKGDGHSLSQEMREYLRN